MDENEVMGGVNSESDGVMPVETPSEPVQPTEPVVPEPELFELPDGRKVDAQTLTKEWKENFLPDYTRKSQELSSLKTPQTITNNEPVQNPYEDPNYIPANYEEVLKVAEERALQRIDAREQERVDQQTAIENEVENQLATLKKADPALNENTLFLHANKYGFRDLPTAYQNMKDMADLAKNVQQTTAKNIAKRNDPVSVTSGNSGGTRPDPSQFSSARDYLRSLQ